MSKYRNKKIEVDGILFDSKKEAERYKTLCLLEKAGMISRLEMQTKFELVPKQNGERAVTYKADFYYFDNTIHSWVAEDVKGYKTKDYIIKRKLMKWRFPLVLFKEVE